MVKVLADTILYKGLGKIMSSNQKQTIKKDANSVGNKEQKAEEKKFSSGDIAQAWQEFKPSIPFSYFVAAKKAVQAKNS